MRCYTWVAVGKGEEGRRNKESLIALERKFKGSDNMRLFKKKKRRRKRIHFRRENGSGGVFQKHGNYSASLES